jgi:hypothetical protein
VRAVLVIAQRAAAKQLAMSRATTRAFPDAKMKSTITDFQRVRVSQGTGFTRGRHDHVRSQPRSIDGVRRMNDTRDGDRLVE